MAVRINTVTPITPPALITMALLWADRALTVDQLLALLARYADYVDQRGFPVTCRPIATRDTVLRGLASLQRHGVVTRNDHGQEVVYLIQPEQRIAAAYHRNGILHFFVLPAIVDLATADDAGALHDEALALRDLFKFEFFFAEKGEFLAEVDAEAAANDRPVTAPFLRPFLEAYWATAEALPRTATSRSTPRRSRPRRADWPSSTCCRPASTAPTRCRAPTSTARCAWPTTGACSTPIHWRLPISPPDGPSSRRSSTRSSAACASLRLVPRPGSWS